MRIFKSRVLQSEPDAVFSTDTLFYAGYISKIPSSTKVHLVHDRMIILEHGVIRLS